MKTSLLLILLLPVVSCQADLINVRSTVFRGFLLMEAEVPFVAGASETIHLNASYAGKDLAINDITVSESTPPSFQFEIDDEADFKVLPATAGLTFLNFPNKGWRTNANETVSFGNISWTFAKTEISPGEVPIFISITYAEAERALPGNALNVTFSFSPGPVPAPEPAQTTALAAILGVCVVVGAVRRLNKPGRH